MAKRHECPVCGRSEGTITIHDNCYICGDDDCGVIWDPTNPDKEPFWPQRYAIGFCPRCQADAREGRMEWSAMGYECPECDYTWYDSRQDGRTLASRLGHTPMLPSRTYDGHPPLTI